MMHLAAVIRFFQNPILRHNGLLGILQLCRSGAVPFVFALSKGLKRVLCYHGEVSVTPSTGFGGVRWEESSSHSFSVPLALCSNYNLAWNPKAVTT